MPDSLAKATMFAMRATWTQRGFEAPVPRPVTLAWKRYLATIRESRPETYEDVEEEVWEELCEALVRLGRPLRRS